MSTPADTRLLLDAMLGKLTTYLRMCGYDTAYALDRGIEADSTLRELAREEERVLLTRDSDLARSTNGAIRIDGQAAERQLTELLEAEFHLSLDDPVRCSVCNGRLQPVVETEETPSYAPLSGDQSVWRCRECGQLFWKGSHWDDVETMLEAVRERTD